MTAVEIPGGALSVLDFADGVGRIHAGVIYGDDPSVAARKVGELHRKIDPIEPFHLNDRSQEALDASLGLGNVVINAAVAGRSRKTPQSERYRLDKLSAQLTLDGVYTALRGKKTVPSNVTHGAGKAYDLVHTASLHKRFKGEGLYVHEDIGDVLFTMLSARALQLHGEALALQERPTFSAMGHEVVHGMLGGLIKESVSHVVNMNNLYKQGPSRKDHTSEGGRLAELAYFTYSLAEWYWSGKAMDKDLVRFALSREDQPVAFARPRRGIDIVRNDRLIQVKKGKGGGVYSDEIEVWSPSPRVEFMRNVDTIVSHFNTVIDNEEDDASISRSRSELARYFANWRA